MCIGCVLNCRCKWALKIKWIFNIYNAYFLKLNHRWKKMWNLYSLNCQLTHTGLWDIIVKKDTSMLPSTINQDTFSSSYALKKICVAFTFFTLAVFKQSEVAWSQITLMWLSEVWNIVHESPSKVVFKVPLWSSLWRQKIFRSLQF